MDKDLHRMYKELHDNLHPNLHNELYDGLPEVVIAYFNSVRFPKSLFRIKRLAKTPVDPDVWLSWESAGHHRVLVFIAPNKPYIKMKLVVGWGEAQMTKRTTSITVWYRNGEWRGRSPDETLEDALAWALQEFPELSKFLAYHKVAL